MLIKLESTTSFLKRRKSQNSGLRRMLWKKRRRFHRPGRWWQLFFGHGIVFIDYFEKNKTITGMYYASLIDKLKAEIAKKQLQREKEKKKISVLSKWCTVSHFDGHHSKNSRIVIKLIDIVFTRSDPQIWLFPVS